jgi:DNA-directed RNA polymerase specialized sigma24 family protein
MEEYISMQQYIFPLSLTGKEQPEEVSEQIELESIFETYYKRVYNYIYFRVYSRPLSEDLTIQVFEKVMLKKATYNPDKSPFEV